MRFDKVLLSIIVQLSEREMARHLPCSAKVIGQALADVAVDYETHNKAGYYPAIEFFKTQPNVDQGMIESAEQVSCWWRK